MISVVQVNSDNLYIGIAQFQTADDDTRNTAKTVDSYLDFITHLQLLSFKLLCRQNGLDAMKYYITSIFCESIRNSCGSPQSGF
jgi:hypothetical protein